MPITLKDGIATAGHTLAMGSASRANVVADRDDLIWERLRNAGAILIGKTTTPEFFHKVTTDSALYGITRNPWSPRHSPGGSSGGAAVTVTTGLVPIAVGSDGGGSLRCPASCTGTLGLKPTRGRVPYAMSPDVFGSYASLGGITRHAADMQLLLSIIGGPSAMDCSSIEPPRFAVQKHARKTDLRKITIGWMANPGRFTADADVLYKNEDMLRVLKDLGAEIEPMDGGFLRGTHDIYTTIGCSSHAVRSRKQVAEEQALWTDSYRVMVDRGLSFSAVDLQIAQEMRTDLFRKIQLLFARYDLIATPTLLSRPMAIEDDGSVLGANYARSAAGLYPFNLTGHPAISIPCGIVDGGLPVGFQLVGPWYREAQLLQIASLLEHIVQFQAWTVPQSTRG